jgi:regulator of sigma E protease
MLSIVRNDQPQEVTVELGATGPQGKETGVLGASFAMHPITPQSLWSACKNGLIVTYGSLSRTVSGFAHILKKRDVSQMAGPVRIIQIAGQGAAAGFGILLIFLAIISINLAILNLFPLPILDGGQILFYTIEAIIRRPINEKIKMYIHLACWVAFLILALFLTWQDLSAIIKPYITRIFGA